MSIATQITALQQTKSELASAIAARGVPTTGHRFSDFATDIASIQSADNRLTQILDKSIAGLLDISDLNITSIGSYAFYERTGLTGIKMPAGVTNIGERAFYSTGLTEIDLPTGLQSIGTTAFSRTGLASIIIPSTVTTFGTSVFQYSSLTYADIYASLTTQYIFQDSTNLQKVKIRGSQIGSKVGTINYCATFKNCTALTKVWIDDTVSQIICGTNLSNYNAQDAPPFVGCTALTDIYCKASSKPTGWNASWNKITAAISATVHWGVSEAEFDAL